MPGIMNGIKSHRIVVTGGPGGGKSTAADLFRRELGERIVVVPEAATMLYAGGFPRAQEPRAQRYVQRAIFNVQRNLEDVQAALYPARTLLCDRGTIDGAAYWPGETEEFFEAMGTTLKSEYARYDAVLFFETAAAGKMGIEGGNPVRIETLEQAVELDVKLRKLWEGHPNFHFIPHQASFMAKIRSGVDQLQAIVDSFSTPG